MKLERICVWLELAKSQRKNELERGLDKSGTQGFEEIGCYDCNGKNYNCENHRIKNEFRNY
jgi:hypothetical protein